MLWAALLHDIGKGESEDDHAAKGSEIIQKLLKRKGMNPQDIETVVFLVRQHLLLIKTATRRDIYDEETAIFCARKLKDVGLLKMLYLLTVADSISTGPMAWNDWTATLLRDFFLKVLNVLENGELATEEAIKAVEHKRNEVIASATTKKAQKENGDLFAAMSPRYRLYMPAEAITDHIQLYKKMGAADFIWDIQRSAEANTRTVTLCAKDRPGLISKIAGVFTLNNIDILDVQVFTWRNNIALDIFKVKPPPDQLLEDEKWIRAEGNLADALSGKLDPAAALGKKMAGQRQMNARISKKPHRVAVDRSKKSTQVTVSVPVWTTR